MTGTERNDRVAARRASDRLPELQRSAALLACGGGPSYAAAASRLALPTDTLVEALLAARRRLLAGEETDLPQSPTGAPE